MYYLISVLTSILSLYSFTVPIGIANEVTSKHMCKVQCNAITVYMQSPQFRLNKNICCPNFNILVILSKLTILIVPIAQLNIAQKIVLNHLTKAGYKNKLDLWGAA